jgi:hypothetical protein
MTFHTASALSWPIKKSLLEYHRGLDGEVELSEGATFDGTSFVFPVLQAGVNMAEQKHFGGAVRLRAHGGLLDVVVARPRLCRAPDATRLLTPTPNGTHILLAESDPIDEFATETGTLRLHAHATHLFGFTYPAGTELAALHFR